MNQANINDCVVIALTANKNWIQLQLLKYLKLDFVSVQDTISVVNAVVTLKLHLKLRMLQSICLILRFLLIVCIFYLRCYHSCIYFDWKNNSNEKHANKPRLKAKYCPLPKRMQLTYTAWVDSLNPAKMVWGKRHKSCPKQEFPSLHCFIPLVAIC